MQFWTNPISFDVIGPWGEYIEQTRSFFRFFGSLTTGAMAADMAVKAPSPSPVVLNWAGFYAGANIGYGWGNSNNDWNLFAAFPAAGAAGSVCAPFPGAALCLSGSDRARLEGVIGGLQAGYNWTSGKYLLGLEADLQYSGQRANQRFNGTYATNDFIGVTMTPGSFTSTYTESIQWLGTLRGRAGYVSDRWMLYATGGLAVGEVSMSGTNTGLALPAANPGLACTPFDTGFGLGVVSCPFGSFSSRETRIGWTLGAGAEMMISNNWSWKVEYLHVDLGSKQTSLATPAGCYGGYLVVPGVGAGVSCTRFAAGGGSIKSRITDEIVRVGLNYHFSGPAVARY